MQPDTVAHAGKHAASAPDHSHDVAIRRQCREDGEAALAFRRHAETKTLVRF